jgi:hypothetical protein
MSSLDTWLNQATRRLSRESAAQVRTEIQEHYDAAREAAISGGATTEAADRAALSALGDAKIANHAYRDVLLTPEESRILKEGNLEQRAICSGWLKWLLWALPLAAFLGSAEFFRRGETTLGWKLLAGGLGIGLLFAAPLLPVYTPLRSRILRLLKWSLLIALLLLILGPDTLRTQWLLMFTCLWPIAWSEWKRISLRRKLPVADWPKHLYL